MRAIRQRAATDALSGVSCAGKDWRRYWGMSAPKWPWTQKSPALHNALGGDSDRPRLYSEILKDGGPL
jgi:hypothetical protein